MTTVHSVLRGAGNYDALSIQGQALVRVQWAKRIEKARSSLRLDHILTRQGREVVELDADGAVVVRNQGRR